MVAVRIRTIALLVTLVVLSAACSRPEGPSTPTAELPTAPVESPTADATSEPTEVAEPDPYAIPADPEDIDKAYVEGVLEALTEPIAAATRLVVEENAVSVEAKQILATTHRGEALRGIIAAYKDALRKAPAHTMFSAQARPIQINVDKVIGARRDCVFALVTQDTSGLAGKEIPPFTAYYQLGRRLAEDDPEGLNPTPWMIVVDAEPPSGGRKYKNPCD